MYSRSASTVNGVSNTVYTRAAMMGLRTPTIPCASSGVAVRISICIFDSGDALRHRGPHLRRVCRPSAVLGATLSQPKGR